MIVQPTHAPYHTGQATDWGAGAARIMGALQQFQQQRYEQRRAREEEAAEKDRLMRQAELERSAAGNPQTMQQLAIEARGGGDVATADYLDDKAEDLWARADKEEEQELARLAEQRRVAAQLTAGDRWRQQFDREGRIPHRQIEDIDGVAMHTMRDKETGAFIGTAGRARARSPLVNVQTGPQSWMNPEYARQLIDSGAVENLPGAMQTAVFNAAGRAHVLGGERDVLTGYQPPSGLGRDQANEMITAILDRVRERPGYKLNEQDIANWNAAYGAADPELREQAIGQVQGALPPDVDPAAVGATAADDAAMMNQLGL